MAPTLFTSVRRRSGLRISFCTTGKDGCYHSHLLEMKPCVLLDIAMPTCYDFVQNQSSFEGDFKNNNFFSHLNFSEIILFEQRHLTFITFVVKPAVIQQL